MADTLKKVLKDLPPGESEDQGIKEYQKQVNALAAPIVPAKAAPVEPGPPELINPSAQYGNRQGEVRYAVDKAGNLTPIAVPQEPVMLAPVAPAHVAPSPAPRSGMKPIIPTSLSQPMPVYDRGGDVVGGTNNNARIVGGTNNNERPSVGMKPIPLYDQGGDVKMTSGGVAIPEKPEHRMTVVAPPDKPEDYMPRYGSEAAVANRPAVAKPEPTGGMKPIPLYDDGGDVDVNDGKHQMAIVKEGERVLTPEENEQYKAEHPEAKGAPVGFSGMVLPNDKNVQPEWDSEHKPTNKAYPGGARMSIDNANIDEGSGDTEHFPTVAPTEASAKEPLKLKPYGQVMDDKVKSKAAEMVSTAQPDLSNNVPNTVGEKPAEERGTPDQREHLDNAVKTDLGKGNFVGAGTALIQKNNLPKIDMDNLQTPSAFQRPGEPALQVPGAGTTPQGGPVPVPAPAPLTGKAAYHAKIQDYDTRYQALMDKAAETNDPQYAEAAERVKAAKEGYQQAHPWGSPESAHPGILGRIGHVAGKVGNIAGDIVAPGLMAITPGTDIHKAIERGQTQAGIKEAAAQNVAEETVDAKAAKALGGTATPAQVTDYQQRVKAISGLTPDAAKTYATVPPGTTAAELDKRFAEATKLTTMNDEQQRTATAEQDRQDRATEQKFQHEQTRQDKLSKAYYTYTTTDPKTGKTQTEMTTGDKLDQLPEDAQLLPVKDPSLLIGEARSMDAVQDSMNELHKDLHDHPEVFDNTAARSIIQTTTEQMNRASAGLLIAGTGGSVPIPSGFGDIINTALQNNTLDEKTAKAVKSYIADYKSAKDKAMVIQMMMQNGKMGRGGQQAFESIVNQLPGGSTPDSATAMRQMASLQRVISKMNSKYPDKYADYTKTEPYSLEEAAPEGTAAGEVKAKTAPKAEHKATPTKGGYSANNPFAPKATATPQP